MIAEFLNQYGYDLIYAIVVAVGGFIGLCLKNVWTGIANDKIKGNVARIAVQGVEQIYKDLHGEQKLDAAMSAASEMLAERNINVTQLELRMLIEAALAELNKAFDK